MKSLLQNHTGSKLETKPEPKLVWSQSPHSQTSYHHHPHPPPHNEIRELCEVRLYFNTRKYIQSHRVCPELGAPVGASIYLVKNLSVDLNERTDQLTSMSKVQCSLSSYFRVWNLLEDRPSWCFSDSFLFSLLTGHHLWVKCYGLNISFPLFPSFWFHKYSKKLMNL